MFVFHILFLVQDFAVCFFIFSFWFWIFLVFLFSNSFLGLGFSWYFFFYNHFLVQDFPDISFFKGNPNSQGILNWIILILHYYYSKQHKNIENSQIIEQNLVIFSLCSSLCLLRLAFFAFLAAVFQFFKRHKWSFVKYIVSFFGLKMVFSKLSLAN